jgi:hypothetical protein
VDHGLDTLTITLVLITTFGRGIGAVELEALGAFEVLSAVSLPEDTIDLFDLEGV